MPRQAWQTTAAEDVVDDEEAVCAAYAQVFVRAHVHAPEIAAIGLVALALHEN